MTKDENKILPLASTVDKLAAMSTSTSGRGRASRSAANTSDEHQEGEDGALLVPPLGAAGGAAASRVLPLALNNANVFASAAAVADHIATLPPIVLADPPGHAAATMAEASAAKTIDGISISIAAAPDTTTTKKRAARASTARARRPLKKKPPLDVGADAMTPNSKSDKPKRLPYGPAQAKFIMDTRRAIDLGKCPAFENDWSNIKPGYVHFIRKRSLLEVPNVFFTFLSFLHSYLF